MPRSSATRNFVKAAQRGKVADATRDKISDEEMVFHVTSDVEKAEDVSLLERLTREREHLTTNQLAAVEKALAWLAESSKPLTTLYRNKFRYWEKGIIGGKARRARGENVKFDPKNPTIQKRTSNFHNVIPAEPKSKLPDWMNDPTLLPKKPPGR